MIDIIACSILSSLCFGLIVFFIVKKLILSRMLIALSCSNDKILTLESKIKQLTSYLNVNVAPTLKQSIISDKIHLNDSNTQLEKQLAIKLQEAIDNNNIIEKAKLDILRYKEEQEKILNQYKEQKNELVSILQNYTSLTKD